MHCIFYLTFFKKISNILGLQKKCYGKTIFASYTFTTTKTMARTTNWQINGNKTDCLFVKVFTILAIGRQLLLKYVQLEAYRRYYLEQCYSYEYLYYS